MTLTGQLIASPTRTRNPANDDISYKIKPRTLTSLMRILLFNPPHPSIGSRIPREHLPPLGLLAMGAPCSMPDTG